MDGNTPRQKVYKGFISRLMKIEKRGIVFEKDYRELRAIFLERIMPYLEKKHLAEITANLAGIGYYVGLGNENSRLCKELRKPVFTIANILLSIPAGVSGAGLDEAAVAGLEEAEDEFFPRLFKQAIKEALDNVLVNNSDYHLFNRGQYVKEKDGEYIIYTFIDGHPHGCKIMIGPFTGTAGSEILFRLYIPRYVQALGRGFDANAAELPYTEISGFADICMDKREMPLNISRPLKDSCLIELWQEDCYNDYTPSFSFDDRDSLTRYRRNYDEVAFILGQRAKYIFLHARLPIEGMPLNEYITRLREIDPLILYPAVPWELTESGDIMYREGFSGLHVPCRAEPPAFLKIR